MFTVARQRFVVAVVLNAMDKAPGKPMNRYDRAARGTCPQLHRNSLTAFAAVRLYRS